MNTIITAQELKEKLSQGPLHFKFIKSDLSERIAHGTTNLAHVPDYNHPKGGQAPNGVIPFYDLEKQAWRSVSAFNTIWI